MDWDSSDSSASSDEILEDVTFLPKTTRSQTSSVSSYISPKKEIVDQSIGSKLDALLSGHQKETVRDEMHQKIKEDLLYSMEHGSQEEYVSTHDEPLSGELAEHIEQLDVKAQVLSTHHPTTTVFNPSKFCCLFKESISPFSCGFARSQFSKVDKVLATIKPDGITPLLLSNILPSSFHQVSSPSSVMMWLYSLLSIHSSPMVVDHCGRNMASIVKNSMDFGLQEEEELQIGRKSWYPKPIELIRILVNMGANHVHLLGDQSLYTDEDVQEHLSVENDENDSLAAQSTGRVKKESCRQLFEILTKCFEMRPECTKEELTLMMCVVMKVSLDTTFHNMDLHRTFQACLSSILECYTDSDWPSVLPSLCHQLRTIPHHHHSAIYLVDLMPVSKRGNEVQIRLSFLLLCSTLEHEGKDDHSILPLEKVSPSIIAQLGHQSPEQSNPSYLYFGLQRLIKEDVYKMNSALTLLDRAVGDENNRGHQPKEELDFLTHQVKLVIKEIRDSINTLDLSRIKDKMTVMSTKWMMTSVQKTKSVQRSLFSWVTSSHTMLPEEKLKDNVSNTNDDGM